MIVLTPGTRLIAFSGSASCLFTSHWSAGFAIDVTTVAVSTDHDLSMAPQAIVHARRIVHALFHGGIAKCLEASLAASDGESAYVCANRVLPSSATRTRDHWLWVSIIFLLRRHRLRSQRRKQMEYY